MLNREEKSVAFPRNHIPILLTGYFGNPARRCETRPTLASDGLDVAVPPCRSGGCCHSSLLALYPERATGLWELP